MQQLHGIDLEGRNRAADPTFRFVPWRQGWQNRTTSFLALCHEPSADLRDHFDLSFACDPDSDRHGIVTRNELMNPNHYLSVAAWYLFRTRREWLAQRAYKTLTSAMLDRVGKDLGRPVVEVPVGFEYGLRLYLPMAAVAYCEESAGASFLCFDGTPGATGQDGSPRPLAAEMMAVEQSSPDQLYTRLTERLGAPAYQRLDAPADDNVRAKLAALTPESVNLKTLAGSPVTNVLTHDTRCATPPSAV